MSSKIFNGLLTNHEITFVDKQGTKHFVGDVPIKKNPMSKLGSVTWLKS